jgi:hypothetical protein
MTLAARELLTLYHCSPAKNRESIRRLGLLPSENEENEDVGNPSYGRVWMTDTVDKNLPADCDIWEVRVSPFEVEYEESDVETEAESGRWFWNEGVSPQHLRLVTSPPANAKLASRLAPVGDAADTILLP